MGPALAAVEKAGSDRVSSGSSSATVGYIKGLASHWRAGLSGTTMAVALLTSLPEPAVVGTAISGRLRCTMDRPSSR